MEESLESEKKLRKDADRERGDDEGKKKKSSKKHKKDKDKKKKKHKSKRKRESSRSRSRSSSRGGSSERSASSSRSDHRKRRSREKSRSSLRLPTAVPQTVPPVNRSFLKNAILDNQKKNVKMDTEEVQKATNQLRQTFGPGQEARLMTAVLNAEIIEKYKENKGPPQRPESPVEELDHEEILERVKAETDEKRAQKLADEFNKKMLERVLNKYK